MSKISLKSTMEENLYILWSQAGDQLFKKSHLMLIIIKYRREFHDRGLSDDSKKSPSDDQNDVTKKAWSLYLGQVKRLHFCNGFRILFRKQKKSRFSKQISFFLVVARYLVAHIEFSQALVWNFFRQNFSI